MRSLSLLLDLQRHDTYAQAHTFPSQLIESYPLSTAQDLSQFSCLQRSLHRTSHTGHLTLTCLFSSFSWPLGPLTSFCLQSNVLPLLRRGSPRPTCPGESVKQSNRHTIPQNNAKALHQAFVHSVFLFCNAFSLSIPIQTLPSLPLLSLLLQQGGTPPLSPP